MGEKEDNKVILLPGKVEGKVKIPLNEMVFGKGGKMEQKFFSEVGKIAKKVLGEK